MNILIVSSYLPYPLYNGGSIRLYNLIKQLRTKHSITLICEKRPKQTQQDIAEVEKICNKVITVPRRKQWSLANVIKTGISGNPFLLVGHDLPQMRSAITKELAADTYDLIHVETFYILQNVPLTTLPIVLIEHNIEYLIYKRYAGSAMLLLRPFLLLDVAKLKRAEEVSWSKATVIGAVSEQDKDIITSKNCYVVPNGVDTKKFQLKAIAKDFLQKHKKILYIGDYSYVQNQDAVRFIISSIWPRIKENLGEKATLWIVGKNMPESLKELGKNDDQIVFDDTNVQPTQDIFSEADVLLAPIRVGGGTSYKILESMAVGTPVITTTLGHEGLNVEKGRDIVVSDDPKDLADQTVALLTDTKRYTELSNHARAAIEGVYDWTVIAKKLEAVYQIAVKQ